MKYITIFGPQAVGKMTVGEELEKQTGLRLFHNHDTIDFALKFFTYHEAQGLIMKLREEVMKTMASSSQKGMIHTFIWDFDAKADWEYVQKNEQIFQDAERYYVELYTDVETRLKRNVTNNRLEKKWTKRNIEWSNNELVQSMDRHRMNSYEGEVKYQNYLRIDNTNLSATETATLIKEYFKL